jgi:prepilin-type N-terminal cleavage/methylation domain-containing protein
MKKANEKGFGLVEIIMAIVIVVLVVAVAYLGIQASQRQQATDTTSSSTSKPNPTSKDTSPTPASLTLDNATSRLTAAGFTVKNNGKVDYQQAGAEDGFITSLNDSAARVDFLQYADAQKASDAAKKANTSDGPIVYAVGNVEVIITNDMNTGAIRVSDETAQKIKTALQ